MTDRMVGEAVELYRKSVVLDREINVVHDRLIAKIAALSEREFKKYWRLTAQIDREAERTQTRPLAIFRSAVRNAGLG